MSAAAMETHRREDALFRDYSVPIVNERFLDLAEVKDRTKASKASIYQWMLDGKFPLGRKRGRRTLWLESEISAWISEQAKSLPYMGRSMGPSRAA